MSSKSVWSRAKNWAFGHDRSIGFGLEYLGHTTLRFPRLLAILVLLTTVFCLVQIPRISVDGDMLRVFAHSGQEYTDYEDLSSTFGTFENDINILVSTSKLTDPEVLAQVREMSLDLGTSEYVSGTMSAFTLRQPLPDGTTTAAIPEDLTSEDEVRAALTQLQQSDPMMRNLLSPDLKSAVIIVFPDQEAVNASST